MFKVLKADRDAYVTDKVISGIRKQAANLGSASSLDLFKLYGFTESGSLPNIELSRLLIHFDLDPIRSLISSGKIDINNPTFSCKLQLFDVDGGQTVPENFHLTIHPLSRSFDEGLGRDIVTFGDVDTCNFLSGSRTQGPWILSGANSGGLPGTVDYLTAFISNGVTSSLEVTQLFSDGTEDLNVDVTTIVSATLAGLIPDEGFRIAFTSSLETDTRTYFVKRFAARQAFDPTFHPRLSVTFDDSVQDDSTDLRLDTSGSLFLYAFSNGNLSNLTSGSSQITGSNSLLLRLEAAVSGGFYDLTFNGSQHVVGSINHTGVYSASILVPSTDPVIALHVARSGSVQLTPIWGSLDGTVSFHTGSKVTVYPPLRGSSARVPVRNTINITNINATHGTNEIVPVRVFIYDERSPKIQLVKRPVALSGIVIRDVHYQVRYSDGNKIVVPFDVQYNSTRLSSDGEGMYFYLDTSNLPKDRTYVIDIMIVSNGMIQVHKAASPHFRVSDIR